MRFFKSHIEWIVFSAGLILLAWMDPSTKSFSFCLFDFAGIDFCPGEGLGHSIAYIFRGDFEAAIEAHFAGPFAVIILSSRIIYLWQQHLQKLNHQKKGQTDGKSN